MGIGNKFKKLEAGQKKAMQQPPLINLDEQQLGQLQDKRELVQQPPSYVQAVDLSNIKQGDYFDVILKKLATIVNEKQYQKIYPHNRLTKIASDISCRVDFKKISNQFKFGDVEIAIDLCVLGLFDSLMYCDDSGSMIYEDDGDRWNSDLPTIIEKSAEITTIFDVDGISVRFFNSNQKKDNIVDPQGVTELIKTINPSGMTPMGTNLRKRVIDPYLELVRMQINGGQLLDIKPLYVLIITDGAPNGESKSKTEDTIVYARCELIKLGLGGQEITYQFAQVGKDKGATQFLDYLDNHPSIGQFIDATSDYETEEAQWLKMSNGQLQMTPHLYMMKLFLGAIDSEWDSKDE